MKKLPTEKQHYVEDNMNLVHMVLHKYIHPHPNDYEDMYQEGCVGLILAAINFDEEKGFKFSTYAVPMIIGTIRRYQRDKKPLLKYSRTLIDLYYKISTLQAQGLDEKEILKRLNIGTSVYFDVINIYNVDSLDFAFDEEDRNSGTAADVLGACDVNLEALESDSEAVFERSLNKTVAKLGETYKAIYEEYIYSRMYGEKLNQEYFAQKYGISQSHVSRILRKLNKVYQGILKTEGVDL